MNKTSNELSLEILNSVQGFYEQSFHNLLWLVGGIFTLAFVVLPIVVGFIQKKWLKLESQKVENSIRNELKTEFHDLFEEERDKFKRLIKDIVDENKLEMENSESKRKKEICDIQSQVYELKAQIVKDSSIKLSWKCRAALESLKSENYRSLGRQLDEIKSMSKEEVDSCISEIDEVKRLIDVLAEHDENNNGIYWSTIFDLKRQFKIE